MLRSVVSSSLRHSRALWLPHHRSNIISVLRLDLPSARKTVGYRFLSSDPTDKSKDKKDGGDAKEEEEENNQIVLTPGQQVVAASRLGLWLGIAVFASACGYFIIKELLPTKMSPNVVFNKALDQIREHPDVKRRFGHPIKGYGRDPGGKREGRRNFIEHTQYKDETDGSNRTRVRFNLEGPHGRAFVFAEVSSAMKSGEFVYVLVQDKSNGRVITVIDNRAALTAARLAGGSQAGSDAFGALLGGGPKRS